MDTVLKIIHDEWAVLASAPWSFVTLVVATFSVAFATCRWAYVTQLEGRREKIEVLNERLNAKDQQLSQFRERLGLTPAGGNKYSRLAHAELQEHALKHVEKIRHWYQHREAEGSRLRNLHWGEMSLAKTEDDRDRLWIAYISSASEDSSSMASEFEQQFKVDAHLLREELLTRLPPKHRDAALDFRYRSPVNTFCYRQIADDLERLAKVLQ